MYVTYTVAVFALSGRPATDNYNQNVSYINNIVTSNNVDITLTTL